MCGGPELRPGKKLSPSLTIDVEKYEINEKICRKPYAPSLRRRHFL